MTKMGIAVTGGSGFIGQAVMRSLRDADQTAWEFDRVDGNNVLGSLYGLRGADSVVHLAGVLGTAELFDDPMTAIDVNIKGALNILRWCEHENAGFVGISMPPVFPSVYTATKVCADRLASAWHHSCGVPVSKVRAFNAYGPGQKHGTGHPQKIVPTFATQAWKNLPIPIWGDGKQTVDLVHVDDLGRMLADATKFGNDETFDGGTGVSVSVNELAEYIIEFTGSTAGIEYAPMRAGEIPTAIVAEGEGWDKLGWKPKFSWDMIGETVQSYHPEATNA